MKAPDATSGDCFKKKVHGIIPRARSAETTAGRAGAIKNNHPPGRAQKRKSPLPGAANGPERQQRFQLPPGPPKRKIVSFGFI